MDTTEKPNKSVSQIYKDEVDDTRKAVRNTTEKQDQQETEQVEYRYTCYNCRRDFIIWHQVDADSATCDNCWEEFTGRKKSGRPCKYIEQDECTHDGGTYGISTGIYCSRCDKKLRDHRKSSPSEEEVVKPIKRLSDDMARISELFFS